MKTVAPRLLLALSCLALATACTTTMRKAPDYEHRMREIHKIGVMPPGATATLIVFTGNNEEIPEVVTRAREELADSATTELRKFDYLVDRVIVDAPKETVLAVVESKPSEPQLQVVQADALPPPPATPPDAPAVDPTPPVDAAPPQPVALETPPPEPASPATEAEIAADSELRFAATQAQKTAEQAMTEMFQSPLMATKEALNYKRSLGPEINQFADMVDSEALFFVRYTYLSKSGGEVAKDVAFTVLLAAATLGSVIVVQPTSVASIQVCLVDGATGDVLYANTAGTQQLVGEPSAKGLMELAMKEFKPRGH